jgi:integrase
MGGSEPRLLQHLPHRAGPLGKRPAGRASAGSSHRIEQAAARGQARRWDARGFVFSTSTGHPLRSQNVTRDLHAPLAAAGSPRQRFHDLRHAFATLQLEAGADVFEMSRALGHACIATTANTYVHFTRAMAQRSADRMTAILGDSASRRVVQRVVQRPNESTRTGVRWLIRA